MTTQRPHHPFGPYPTHTSSATSVVVPRREGRTVPTSSELFDGGRREAQAAAQSQGHLQGSSGQHTQAQPPIATAAGARSSPTATSITPPVGSTPGTAMTGAGATGQANQMVNAWRERLVNPSPVAEAGSGASTGGLGSRVFSGTAYHTNSALFPSIPVPSHLSGMNKSDDKLLGAQTHATPPASAAHSTGGNHHPGDSKATATAPSRYPALGEYLNRQDNHYHNGPSAPTGAGGTVNGGAGTHATNGNGNGTGTTGSSNTNMSHSGMAPSQKLGMMSPPNPGLGGLFSGECGGDISEVPRLS